MSNHKIKIAKGVRIMAFAIVLMFLGPVLLSIGFRALNDGIYIWSILGGIVSLTAIVLVFIGIKTIMSGLFEDKDE